MNRKLKTLVLSLILSFVGFAARGQLLDGLKGLLDNTTNLAPAGGRDTTASIAALGQDEIVKGLKEALDKGLRSAVASLGQTNGFLTNLNVKIPLPEKLQKVESTLRIAGQAELADEFITTMNRAAEQAVPVATSVFIDALSQMTLADARALLSGPDDAATQYFRRTTQTNLQAKFLPIVKKATDSVGVTAKYKAMTGKFDSVNSIGSFFGSKTKLNFSLEDVDAYVTQKALDGLFLMVAEKEKAIRANPVARTTDLLQKVFGAAAK